MNYETHLDNWVDSFIHELKPALAPALTQRLETHLSTRCKDGNLLYNFTRAAQPVVHLPIWVAQSLKGLGMMVQEIHLRNAIGSAISGYLMAQLQDELIDTDEDQSPDTMLLAQALFLKHKELLQPAMALSPLFRARWHSLWANYTNALSLERVLSRGKGVTTRDEFHRILGRSQPMALPGGSLLAIVGRDDLLSDYEAIIRLTTRAAQLVDDTADALEDLKEGNKTWVVCKYGGLKGSQHLTRSLYIEEGFSDVLRLAKEDLDAARSIAQAKRLIPLHHELGKQQVLIEQVEKELLHSIYDISLSSPAQDLNLRADLHSSNGYVNQHNKEHN